MKVSLLSEFGYDEAMLGVSLSYNSSVTRAKEIAPKLAFGVPGESKFLESIYLWIDTTAPRYFWQEADTYRISTKQSESTMHTLMKKPLTMENFEEGTEVDLDKLNSLIQGYKDFPDRKKYYFEKIKRSLPEGFLQRRIWTVCYKTFQNIYFQRKSHRLKEWHYFLDTLLGSIAHPEFIIPQKEEK